MSSEEKKIIDLVTEKIPLFSELDKSRLLGFVEGLTFKIDETVQHKEPTTAVV